MDERDEWPADDDGIVPLTDPDWDDVDPWLDGLFEIGIPVEDDDEWE